jgi:hypothetical protein
MILQQVLFNSNNTKMKKKILMRMLRLLTKKETEKKERIENED